MSVAPLDLSKARLSPSAVGGLGNIAKHAAKSTAARRAAALTLAADEARRLRFALQESAGLLVPHERVQRCCRWLAPKETHVQVKYSAGEQRAHYSGLVVCGSVWLCPVCSVRVAEERRRELAAAVAACHDGGGSILHVTYTVRHGQGDELQGLLDRFVSSYRRLTGHRTYREELRPGYQIFGSVRGLEVTHGENGWHPHYHVLLFLSQELTPKQLRQLEKRLRDLWQRSALKDGLTMNDAGLNIRATKGAIGDYITKYGRDPKLDPWGVESELAKSHVKTGRKGSRTPWDMLREFTDSNDGPSAHLWREYATVFKGRQQLVWSPGLRAVLGLLDVKTDAEAAAALPLDAVELGWVSLADWHLVLRYRQRAALLNLAGGGEWPPCLAFLFTLRARYKAERVLRGLEALPAPPRPKQYVLFA